MTALERDLREARLDRGLSQEAVGGAVGLDRSWVSRLERGLVTDLSIVQAAELLAAVGLDLSARAYPSASVVRDAPQRRLLGRFRGFVHPSLGWRTEVPLPIPGDLRAWDALIAAPDWRCGVEAETHPHDLQALERRLGLKLRDGAVDCVILVLPDTRHCRAILRDQGDSLRAMFPVTGRDALTRLGAGQNPGGNAIVVL